MSVDEYAATMTVSPKLVPPTDAHVAARLSNIVDAGVNAMQVVTVEPGGLSGHHEGKIRLLIVSSRLMHSDSSCVRPFVQHVLLRGCCTCLVLRPS